MKLASRFGRVNQIRRDRPLTREELMSHVPSVFSEEKHESRSERYTYIPTITLLDSLQREGFEPFFACQTRVRDQSRREHTKHMLRLRRAGQLLAAVQERRTFMALTDIKAFCKTAGKGVYPCRWGWHVFAGSP